jgi:hypothetical protein
MKGTWPKERTGKNDDLGILFLGDSVDGYFVGDVCKPILQGRQIACRLRADCCTRGADSSRGSR